MKEFAGKVALVTGAAHGIGYSYCTEAAKRGMKLSLVDIDGPAMEKAAEDFRALGAEVITNLCDVSVYDECKAAIKNTMDHYGQIDTLLANAGICTAGNIVNMPITDWEWAMNVNTMGVVYFVKEVLPIMIAQKTPCHLMITASIAGLRAGMGANPPYFASKHAAVAVAESVQDYVKGTGDDIGVAVFCPMYVHTYLDH